MTRVPPLLQLARLYGVETAYFDIVAQRRRETRPEVLLAVLRALGAPIEKLEDAPAAARKRRLSLWQRAVEPVVVAWEDKPAALKLRLPAQNAAGKLRCQLELETGETRTWRRDLADLPAARAAEVEGTRYVSLRVPLPGRLPPGYHRLRLEIRRQQFETLVIAAPRQAYTPAKTARAWGVFLPLYALRSLGSWGAGDLTDLEALMDWVRELGGGLVGTLPLLAAMLDEPFEPSPYAPASRLFWNEFYVDVTRSPEFKRSPAAQRLLASDSLRAELDDLRAEPLVDYRRTMALKEEMLRELARTFFAAPGGRQAAFEKFLRTRPELEDYARFRAAAEQRGVGWPEWPAPLRDGVLREGDYDEEARRYHLYAQWLAEEQITALAKKTRRGPGLYLDLPVGTHPAGYDVWREREAFALGLAAGAPPDSLFIKGQNWGFPPLHPERLRAQGYRYFIACLRHHLRPASVLRIDHVMSLHHLLCIPPGVPTYEGTYIRYAAEELYAIVALESQRHQAVIVGEDLGTVPFYVRPAMARHGIQRSYVLPFEMDTAGGELRPPAAHSLASLNTHDMRPFHGFWLGLDLQDRVDLRLLEEREVQQEREAPQWFQGALTAYLERAGWLAPGGAHLAALVRACLDFLAASPARLVLVNLEDLWLETEAQNTPGTVAERPNWRRKARYSLEAFCQMPAVLDTLRAVNEGRKGRRKR